MASTREISSELEKKAMAIDHISSSSSDGVHNSLREHVTATESEKTKKLLLKTDLHLISILSLLYLCAFVDRINIGNARIQGLETDLNMHGHDYSIALFVFFIPYILLEVPCNLILNLKHRVEPAWWLGGIMFGWGIITICQGLTGSFAGLVICRLLLGVFEAGFVPGALYLISSYYRRYELQRRINWFFCASILAGAFSGLLAYAIADHMNEIGGYGGWRWIFILEGLCTVVIAVGSVFVTPSWPERARFLDEEERKMLTRHIISDAGTDINPTEASTEGQEQQTLDLKMFRQIVTNPKILLGTLMYLGIVNTGYATSFFTPTILKQLHWTSVKAQVMSIPIYVVAAVVVLIVAHFSDHLQHRFAFTILGCVVATIGYVVLLNMDRVSTSARYFALYLITTGGYITQPLTIAWLSNNLSDTGYERAIGLGMQIGFGNIGGIIASNIFLADQAPRYPVGFGVSLALVWVCGGACVAFFLCLRKAHGPGERHRGSVTAAEDTSK